MDDKPLSLQAAQRCILAAVQHFPRSSESVSLQNALGRISATHMYSQHPKPSFRQATRDGFAVAGELPVGECAMQVVATMAAGASACRGPGPGEVVRIMTGALVPEGCQRIIPLEYCRDEGHRVIVDGARLPADPFIRERGCDWPAGHLLVRQGTSLKPEHLLHLAEDGCGEIEVYKVPTVRILCTGSELLPPGERCEPGRKISGNGVLLTALVAQTGVHCLPVTMVADDLDTIKATVREIVRSRPAMVITTGGLGPGRYDLLEAAVCDLRGRILYRKLHLRPGKSTLFALVDNVIFFCLPGPPPAVRLLYHELIAPALRYLLGHRHVLPPRARAFLSHATPCRPSTDTIPHLRGGVVTVAEQGLEVVLAGKDEAINGILVFSGKEQGEECRHEVTVDLVDVPAVRSVPVC